MYKKLAYSEMVVVELEIFPLSDVELLLPAMECKFSNQQVH